MGVIQKDISEKAQVQGKPANRKIKATLAGLVILSFAIGLAVVGFKWKQKIDEERAWEQWVAHMQSEVEVNTFYDGISLDGIPLAGLTMDEAERKVQERVEALLEQMTFILSYENHTWTFTHQDIGAYVDWKEKLKEAFGVARTGELESRYNKVMELKEKGLNFSTQLSYDIELLRDDIEAIAEQIYVAPVDATIEFFPDEKEMFKITPEQGGLYLDTEKVMDELKKRADSGQYGELVLKATPLEPQVKSVDLQKLTHRIVQFSTNLGDSNEKRTHNVIFALSKVNGLRLDPGEVFSFNKVVGPRTLKAGFEMAPVIMPDKSMQDDEGGGVCQSSSTLYNAVLRADLEIIERYHHSFPVSYIPIGLDATVTYGGADLKFRNNRETPIFIRTYSVGRDVFVEIYGEPLPDGMTIDCVSEIVETIPAPKAQEIEDKEGKYVTKPGQRKVHVSSKPGYRVKSYKVYYVNGEKVKTELIVNDYYKPIKGIIYYKPALPPEPGKESGQESKAKGAPEPEQASGPEQADGEQ